MVILLDLGHLRGVQIDIEGDDLDAFGDRPIDRCFQGFGQTELDDDAVDAEIDRLIDHLALTRRLLPGIEYPQVGPQRFGLFFDAAQIRLREVPGEQIPHQRDLHLTFVERCGCAGQGFGLSAQCHRRKQRAGEAMTGELCD
ncbi:hypothetical protein D3C78_1553950 [compost metagenome]